MQLDEQTGFLILAAGVVVLAIGYLWLMLRAFRTSILWGLVSLLLAPLGGLLFALVHITQGRRPLLVILLGAVIAASPVAINLIAGGNRDTGVEEIKPAEGGQPAEERLTLTGAKPSEYEMLNAKKTYAVIQWANADVTDDLAESLRGMENLRELDLNSSQITDRTLALLATLPKLESLRLAGTKITDEGFRTHLLPLERLKELDLTGTAVRGPTAREWKAAQPDRRVVR